MKHRKLLIIFIVVILLLSQFSFLKVSSNIVYAVDTKEEPQVSAKRYFYDQLTQEGKNIYQALEKMESEKILQQNGSLDILAEGFVTEEQVVSFTNGSQELLSTFGAARDAFQYDNPKVFYIDYSALTLRVTTGSDGYHAYIGPGRRDTYYLPGFNADNIENKISEFNTKLNEVVEKIQSETEQKLQEELEDAQEIDPVERTKTLVKTAHDWVTHNMMYKFEYEVTGFNTQESYSNARTAYDCLMYGEGVCECYTRGFKALLDELDIPCVCVYGLYKVSDVQDEEHIWNYVYIDGKWYGVDVTHDDPVVKSGPGANQKVSNRETNQYLLVGQIDLNSHHIPSGVLSPANYEFNYPELSETTIEGEEFYNQGLFKIRTYGTNYAEGGEHSGGVGTGSGDETIKTTEVWVSYDGKNYTQNAQNGIYMLARFAEFDESSNEWLYTSWGYMTPELYDSSVLEGKRTLKPGSTEENPEYEYSNYSEFMGGNYVCFPMPQLGLIQFAVTDVAPKYKTQEEILAGGLYYQGSQTLLTERTEEIINPYELYKAPPHITKATPAQYLKLGFGNTYHMKLYYDDVFEPIKDEEGNPTGEKIEAVIVDAVGGSEWKTRPSALEGSTITNFTYNLGKEAEGSFSDDEAGLEAKRKAQENAVIEFDFTPSDLFANNETLYTIEIRGVQGISSGKRPITAGWGVGAPSGICSIRVAQGLENQLFAQPELMDVTGSINGWEGFGGDDLSELNGVDLSQLTHRLALVTTTTTEQENKDMLDEVGINPEDKNIITETYNIKLQVCCKTVVKTGTKLRLCVGFPEGTTYEDYLSGNKEFKVYHYKYNDFGEITGYEPIDVIVTRQGLILLVDSFSPFTIAAMPGTGTAPQEKQVVLASSEGGTIKYQGSETNTINMNEVEEIELQIEPEKDEEGNNTKVIKSITVGNLAIPVENKDGMTIKVKASDLGIGTTTVHVAFMSKAVEQIDEAKGESEVISEQPTFNVDLETEAKNIKTGDTFKISAKLKDFQSIQDGIVTFTGKLEFDENVFQLVNITGLNAWQTDFETDYNNGNFVLDREEPLKMEQGETSGIFEATFKVLDSKVADEKEAIMLNLVKAGTGEDDGLIVVNNTSQIDITSNHLIDSAKYNIDVEHQIISKIIPGTTISELKQNVTLKSENIIFKDKNDVTIETDDVVLTTGSKIIFSDSEVAYTAVVTGDIDGDSSITVNDLAKIKLHLVSIKQISEEANLVQHMAADMDGNNEIGLNDLAKMKLIIIGATVLE